MQGTLYSHIENPVGGLRLKAYFAQSSTAKSRGDHEQEDGRPARLLSQHSFSGRTLPYAIIRLRTANPATPQFFQLSLN